MFQKVFFVSALACLVNTTAGIPLKDQNEGSQQFGNLIQVIPTSSSQEETAAHMNSKFFFDFLATIFNAKPNPIWIPLPQLDNVINPPPAPAPAPVNPEPEPQPEPQPEPPAPEDGNQEGDTDDGDAGDDAGDADEEEDE